MFTEPKIKLWNIAVSRLFFGTTLLDTVKYQEYQWLQASVRKLCFRWGKGVFQQENEKQLKKNKNG